MSEQIIDGKECRYWFRPNPGDYRKCSLRGKNDNCDEIKDCFVKELLGKLARKEQECEELKKQLIQKDEVNTFFNTLDWNSAPCEICPKKNCLDEIEGIVNFISNITNCDKAYYCKDKLDEILQKISECEGNNEN